MVLLGWRGLLEMRTVVYSCTCLAPFVLEEQRGWASQITAISSLDAQPSSVLTYTMAI